MQDQSEMDDGSGYCRDTERKVTLDMLTDKELIDELVNRNRLLVITARRSNDIGGHRTNELCMGMMELQLIKDIGEHMFTSNLVSTSMQHNMKTGKMEYTSLVVMLTALPEESIN